MKHSNYAAIKNDWKNDIEKLFFEKRLRALHPLKSLGSLIDFLPARLTFPAPVFLKKNDHSRAGRLENDPFSKWLLRGLVARSRFSKKEFAGGGVLGGEGGFQHR